MLGGAQQRQDRVRHPDRAEHVDRESLHRCLRGELLSAQPGCRGARVVDQDVQVPVFVAYPGGRRLDAAVVGRVEVDEGRTELLRRFGTTLRIAGTGQHGMAKIDEPPGCLVAETLVGPGDQRDGHRVSLPPRQEWATAQGVASMVPRPKPLVFRAPDSDQASSIRPVTARSQPSADHPDLRARPTVPSGVSRRIERRILVHCRRSALVTDCDPISGRAPRETPNRNVY